MHNERFWLMIPFILFFIKLSSAASLFTLVKHEAPFTVSVRNDDNIHVANGALLNQAWVLTMISEEQHREGLSNVSGGSMNWYPDSERPNPSKIIRLTRSKVLYVDVALLEIQFMKFINGITGPAPTMSLGYAYRGNIVDYGWAMGEFNNEDKGPYWRTMFKGTGSVMPTPACLKYVALLFPNQTEEVLKRKYMCSFAVKSPGALRVGPGAPSIYLDKFHTVGLTAAYVNEVQIHIKFDLFYKWYVKIIVEHAEKWNKRPGRLNKDKLFDIRN